MNSTSLTESDLIAAFLPDVRQSVVIGSRSLLPELIEASRGAGIRTFAVDERPPSVPLATFVPTRFTSEALPAALTRSSFASGAATLVVWLGGVGYSTVDLVLATLGFVASLPKGSAIVFDYTVECTAPATSPNTALQALASRICSGGGNGKRLIHPQALATMLSNIGFREIVDLPQDETQLLGVHLVKARV